MNETDLIDVAWSKPTPAAVKAAGYAGVIGYISHDSGKDLGALQARKYLKAGLRVALVFETLADEAEHNAATGAADCRYAEQRARAMGYPKTCPIFYAVDEDVAPEKVAAYFAGIHRTKDQPSGPYGSARICNYLAAHHEADVEWQTVAWSGDEVSKRACIYQRNVKHHKKVAGIAHNAYDEDVVLKEIHLWGGQLMPPASHPAKPVKKPKKAKKPRRTVKQVITTKMKAFVGAITAAVIAYFGTAFTTGNSLTAHGLELAITTAAATFFGIHQVTNAPDPAEE